MRQWKIHRRETFPFLKKESISYKKQKEILREKERIKKEIGKNFSLQRSTARPEIKHEKQNFFEETGWNQYKLRPENKTKEKQSSVNTATIHGIAKRLMAREWTRALGRKTGSKLEALEREAAYWKRRIEKYQGENK